ncbi:MAG: L,D-transpeptidase family protein [Methyloceanibacter sp.]|uniref:L,D-transpeptidase family protein n=1 Tax=Methyloceanibacter sp. TaxID=1965321 RepID=UPI003D6D8ACD
MRPIYSLALTLLLAAPLSLPASAAEPDAPGALITRAEAIRMAVQNRLAGKFTVTTEHNKDEKGALVEYYSVPDQKLLWVDQNGLTDRGKAVIAEIKEADDYGLRAADYEMPDMAGFSLDAANATEQLADAEIKISYAVLDYTYDARGGRIEPQRISKNLDPTLALPDPLQVIESIAFRSDPAAYLRSFQPQQPQFDLLRKKLIALRGGGDSAEAEKPEVKIPDGPLLKLGIVDPQVALLRTRLDVPEGQNPHLYDEAVLEAVRQFQVDHNTAPDGVVGSGTRRLLNQPHLRNMGSPAQINAILINMERWRWLPHDLGAFYVNVNIPEFTLRVVKEDETIHTARVVVGKTDTQTPIFSNEMKTVVFGPYWNVPTSIKVEEIRPYVRQNGGFFFGGGWNTSVFQRHNLRIKYGGREVDPASLDWNRVDIRNLHLYQPPGPGNVLGQVKFMFPNKHDVYMHDTPQKHLFAKQVRAESHGCMRVQNPDQLATVIMSHDKGWSQARTLSAFENSYDQHVALNGNIPVHITYFTLRVNEDGSITTFNDLYGHDGRMSAALFGGRNRFTEPSEDEFLTQSISQRPPRRGGNPIADMISGF